MQVEEDAVEVVRPVEEKKKRAPDPPPPQIRRRDLTLPDLGAVLVDVAKLKPEPEVEPPPPSSP